MLFRSMDHTTDTAFTGAGPALQALLQGSVKALASAPGVLKQQADSGAIRILANWGAERAPAFPKVKTFRELGYPNVEFYIWAGLSAPAGTPDTVIARLNEAFNRVLSSAEIRDKWRAADFEPLVFTPEQFQAYVQADSRRWAEAVRVSGFKASE